jgi:rubredoxin
VAIESQTFCPGSKTLREAVPEDFPCPRCGSIVEIWTDEPRRKCSNCGATVSKANPTIVACAEWCASARECLGEELYARWQAMKAG